MPGLDRIEQCSSYRGGGRDTRRNSCKGCATELFPRGEGGLPYKSDRDDHRQIQIKPLRETNVGVVQAVQA